MKESVTKFDFEAAFKALDEIDVPSSDKGIKANRPALTEIFSRKSKFDSLFEEYYDIGSTEELGQAKEDREAEVAKAKLERIEKIVDLDADSPEDLLTSYVGKYIIQCPQCMTLFYKNQEDVVESEDDPNTVNVSEVCQHCGNESGYTLVGKVGEATAEEAAPATDEIPADEIPVEEASEDGAEETTEEPVEGEEDLGDFDLEALNLDDEAIEEEEKKEESFVAHTGEALVEGAKEDSALKPGDRISTWNDDEGTVLNIEGDHCEVEWDDGNVSWIDTVDALEPLTESKETNLTESLTDDKELDAKLKAHNEYIEYLRTAIADEEAELEKIDNGQVKAAIQRRIDAYKEDLEKALPDEVKNSAAVEEPVEETAVEEPVEMEETEATLGEALTEALKEDKELEVSADEFEKLINEPEFKKPISDTAVRAMLNAESDEEREGVEEALTEGGLKDLGRAIGKKIKQGAQNLKNKVSTAIDKFADSANTRDEKANWILKNAVADGITSVSLDADGNVVHNNSQRFKTFLVIGFKGYFSNGEQITSAPSADDLGKMVIGVPEAQTKLDYKDADGLAKGWSSQANGGPAFIYLAKDKDDDNAVFLCTYFKGELANDQLEKYFSLFKKDVQSKVQIKNAGGVSDSSAAPQTKTVKAADLNVGDKLKFVDSVAEVTGKTPSAFGDDQLAIKIKTGDGNEETINVNKTATVTVIIDAATESLNINKNKLNSIMEDLEEVQESSLETLISSSLVESYGNVAGFKLNECAYLNNKFTIDGTVYFTSGAARKLTYVFSEAYNENGRVKLCGLNEKLGKDRRFTITGKINSTNKTFITESFIRNK